MSSLDSASNHHTLGHTSDAEPATYESPTTSSASSSIPHLPAYAYTRPSVKRPKVSTAFEQNTSSVRTNGNTRSHSPDPHDFYRRHQDQYRASLQGALGKGDIRVESRDGGKAGTGQRASPITTRSGGPKLPPLTSRMYSCYNTSPTSDRSPLSAARSSPTLSSTARNRQTSLKDLVDKFNQKPDEALPLPKRSGSRSPSITSNPGGPSTNTYIQPRTSSLSAQSSDGSGRKTPSTGNSRPRPRKGHTNEDFNASPRPKRPLRAQRTDAVNPGQFASQSTTELGRFGGVPPRKPLFGEILAMSPTHPDLGYGIPASRRRRGSEGSMHSPNPMFPQEQGKTMLDMAPSSPSAWYLGVTPTLEDIKSEKNIPDLPLNLHRRTRSDFSGAPSRPPTSRMYGVNLSPSREPPSSPSPTNTNSKRNSQSRIPISIRRTSTASNSSNSTQSTRPGSALGKPHVKIAKRPAALVPRHIQNPRSPPQHSRSSTPQKSPRRGDFSAGAGRPATSPRLTAYISAPMPKKSPPLRSSRPRQPVSNASTSASRARAVERFSSHENGNTRIPRETRPRKPPELAGVDFAARRQKIQQAVTKTVKENERKDEERRASMALSKASEGHALDSSAPATDIDISRDEDEAPSQDLEVSREDVQDKEGIFQDVAEETPKSEHDLTVDTGQLQERSILDQSMEDSPTLGTFDRFPAHPGPDQDSGETTPSDIEPSSAITAGTSDSVDTFFDDEPQDDSQNSTRQPSYSHEHQNLLNHITTMRDPSPRPEMARKPVINEESASEKDDRESIQIMLGETPVLEKTTFKARDDEERENESQPGEGPESRWSMSSWTSSIKSRDDREAPMERIDEYSPSNPAQPTHLSISTSSSQQTPQPWSPQSFSSPRTARTTMDSDAYSTINHVLDHYHDPSVPGVISPDLMNDFQQHINIESPELARQGGWDPKKVTALYLQQVAQGRYGQSPTGPNPHKFQIRSRSSSNKVPETPEKEVRSDHDGKMVPSMEHKYESTTPLGTSLAVEEDNSRPARASLTGPDDWDMSPSLGGLHLQAEAIDSPSEDKPMLPPKDWRIAREDFVEMPERDNDRDTPPIADSHPQLPPLKGLGLDINIVPPQQSDSPTIPAPPLPLHSPPPPPTEPLHTVGLRSPPSPSIYSKHVPSSSYPAQPSTDPAVPPLPNITSNDSRESRSKSPSIPQSASSLSLSQDRPSVDQQSTAATSKNSSPSPDQKRLTRRRHIVKELVDTEHSFGQDMKVVDDIYRGTANIIVISAEDVKVLFGNSDQIVAFSTNFLDALKRGSRSIYTLAKSKRWKPNRVSNATSYSSNTDDQSSINGVELSEDEKDRKTFIGEQFGNHMANMEKVYTEYLKNHDAANQKLQALQKNPKVQIWLKECRAYAHDLTLAWDLDSLLVKPVQRILKYPLLLDQLLEVTPDNHPDFTALDVAAREMKGMAKRIDELKKRADLMEQVTNTRKRKESDVRIGLSKAFGRRTEKIRQQAGDMPEDKGYTAVSEKFGSNFFQLQVVMRDVEMYTNDAQTVMHRVCEFALAVELHLEVSQTNYPELESKWRKFRQSTTEMSRTALTDHIAAVRKNVIDPMTTLIQLHDGPQKLMVKRKKRVADYARFKAIKDRGDKPDKKTIEQGEQFQAINDTLKDDLPKLFTLTGKLVEACLNNFVQLQVQWQIIWKRKLIQALDDDRIPATAQEVVDAFKGDFAFIEAQVLSLGICNGSMLNDVTNQISFLSPSTTLTAEDSHTPRQASHSSSFDLSKSRTLSISSDKSPVLPQPDFGSRSSGSFLVGDGVQLAPAGNYVTAGRIRASSTLSGQSPRTPEVPGAYHSPYSNNTTPVTATPNRPSTANPRSYTDSSISTSRPSIETTSLSRPSQDSSRAGGFSGPAYPPSAGSSQHRDASDSQRYSGFFSSAMPMSDSPPTQSPAPGSGQRDFNVIFLAASVYEFNIDRARKEAGYPYLTYVAGEIFDVIGEKGELWLAKNQDDGDNLVGWIWNKHFVKLAQ